MLGGCWVGVGVRGDGVEVGVCKIGPGYGGRGGAMSAGGLGGGQNYLLLIAAMAAVLAVKMISSASRTAVTDCSSTVRDCGAVSPRIFRWSVHTLAWTEPRTPALKESTAPLQPCPSVWRISFRRGAYFPVLCESDLSRAVRSESKQRVNSSR